MAYSWSLVLITKKIINHLSKLGENLTCLCNFKPKSRQLQAAINLALVQQTTFDFQWEGRRRGREPLRRSNLLVFHPGEIHMKTDQRNYVKRHTHTHTHLHACSRLRCHWHSIRKTPHREHISVLFSPNRMKNELCFYQEAAAQWSRQLISSKIQKALDNNSYIL